MIQIRRIIFFFIAILALTVNAEEMSYAAKTFRSNIQSFLREEGFSPSVDNDGSLCFKKEGTQYWIDVLGDKPFYVTFRREGMGTKDANSTAILKTVNDVNTNIRAVKCCYYNDYVGWGIESYCYVAEDFKYVFYTYLNILEATEDAIKETYSKYDSSASAYNSGTSRNNGRNSESSFSATSGSRSGNTVHINGPILETEYHKWWATSIDLNYGNTIVHKIVVPKASSTYVCSTKDEYIEDCDTGKRYYIQSSTIGLSPSNTTLTSKKSTAFSDTYPALPQSVRRINIWSGSDYYAKNLQIR